MGRWRRVLRIGGWIVASLLGAVLLLCAALLVAGNTDPGRRLIEGLTARLTGGQVQIAGLGGSFPGDISLAELRLRDAQGVWLTGQRIRLTWSPLALLQRRIRVETLTAGRLDVERMPVAGPPSPQREPFQLPRIDVRHARIDILELGPALAGQRTQLTLQGRARLISMEDARAQVLATRVGGPGRYEVSLSFDPSRMDAAVSLQEPAGGPLENLVKLPGMGALTVKGTLSGPRTAEQLDLAVQAGQLQGQAHGTVDLAHRTGSLNYALQAPAMSPRAGLAWQGIDVRGSSHGPWTAPVADGKALIEQLRLPGGFAIRRLTADSSAASGLVHMHVQADGLVIPGPRPELLAGAPLVVDASMRLTDSRRPLELTAQHPLIWLQAKAVTAGNLAMTLQARLPDIRPLADIAGLDLKGPATLDGEFARNGADNHITLNARADVSGGGQPDWGRLLGRGSQLHLEATLTDRSLTLTRFNLTGRAGTFSLSGSGLRAPPGSRDPLQSLEADAEVTLTDLAAVSPTLAGRLTASAKVSGPWRSLTAEARATSTLSVRGSVPSTLVASVTAHDLPSAPAGTLEAHGTLDGAPLKVSAQLDREPGGVFHVTLHSTTWKSAHAQGEVRAASQLERAQGSLALRVEHLEDLQRLLGMPLKGRVTGEVALTSARGQTHAQLSLSAQDAMVAGIRGSGQLTASGAMDALPVHLALDLPELHGAPARLEATGQLRWGQKELELLSAKGSYRGEPVTLGAPAHIRFSEGLTVSELHLAVRQTQLALAGRLTPALDLRATLTHVDAGLVNVFVPGLLAQGTAGAELQLRGPLAAPQGQVQFQVTGLRLARPSAQNLPLLAAHGTAQLRGTEPALLDATLTGGDALQLTLHGQLPVQRQAAAPAAAGGLDLALSGKADLSLINPLLEAEGRHAAGALTVKARLTGTLAAPEIGGDLELTKGDLRDYNQGVHLSNVSARLTARQGQLTIEHLTAHAATGDVNVTGSIAVLEPLLPVQLHLTAQHAQPLASDVLTANLDADLTLKGTLQQRVVLAGTIHVNRADIRIPNSLPADVAVLDVRRPGEAPPQVPEHPLEIALDVRLDAPRQVLVTGRGLDAELGGSLRIRGTKDAPQVSGGFDLIRGTLSLASTPLTFKTGKVSFNGAGLQRRLDPSLDFTAQTSVADATATLRITGLADSPQFQLSSTPQELPQDEILARLLFGQSASTLSASQVVTVGSALATVTGVGSGISPLVKVQKTLGLDRLSVSGGTPGVPTTAQNTGATLEAGRYVASNVFVSARQSTTGVTQLVVDVDITRNLKVRTRLGNGTTTAQGVTPENDPGSSLGVSYQFEY